MMILAALITVSKAEIAGVVLFAYIIGLYMSVFDDLISSMLPFLLLCTFSLKCYDSFDTFMDLLWLSPPVIFAIIFHFVIYKKRISIGENFWGSCTVALAVTLGGLFSISLEDYFRPISLYYVFALGIGMLVGYLAMRSSLESRPIGESSERFAVFMYLWGVFAAFMILQHLVENWSEIAASDALPYIQWSNNISTVIMFALPFPFYFALKRPIHLISGYTMYAALLLASSRGGLLFGTAEMIIITIYVLFAPKRRLTGAIVSAVSLGALLILYLNLGGIYELLEIEELIADGSFIASGESRITLLRRSIEDFKSNFWFGRGLGYQGNIDAYEPKKGALYFYHMMIPQIIGSMGVCGIVGYLYQFALRVRTILKRINAYNLCLFISYLGIFMMSQVNPGEFCPLPYGFVTVALFVILESQPTSDG